MTSAKRDVRMRIRFIGITKCVIALYFLANSPIKSQSVGQEVDQNVANLKKISQDISILTKAQAPETKGAIERLEKLGWQAFPYIVPLLKTKEALKKKTAVGLLSKIIVTDLKLEKEEIFDGLLRTIAMSNDEELIEWSYYHLSCYLRKNSVVARLACENGAESRNRRIFTLSVNLLIKRSEHLQRVYCNKRSWVRSLAKGAKEIKEYRFSPKFSDDTNIDILHSTIRAYDAMRKEIRQQRAMGLRLRANLNIP